MPVLISRSALPKGLLRVSDNLQLLNPEHPLIYLYRRHCIEAASRLFTRNYRQWIANLYSNSRCCIFFYLQRLFQLMNSDLSKQVKNVLYEYNLNSVKFFDRDILRQICISIIRGDSVRREKFIAKLSMSKQNYLKCLKALPYIFWDSIDDLILFAGLQLALFIGTFARLLNLYYPEV